MSCILTIKPTQFTLRLPRLIEFMSFCCLPLWALLSSSETKKSHSRPRTLVTCGKFNEKTNALQTCRFGGENAHEEKILGTCLDTEKEVDERIAEAKLAMKKHQGTE